MEAQIAVTHRIQQEEAWGLALTCNTSTTNSITITTNKLMTILEEVESS